jgi:hypothetical protein
MVLCGDKGFTTKSGKPCGYRLGENDACCPHHSEDKSFAKSFQMKGVYNREDMRLPGAIETNGFESTDDIRRTLAHVAKEMATNKRADMKRLLGIVSVCGVANSVIQNENIAALNETIMRAEGHGPALVILQGLKTGQLRLRRLPGVAERPVKEANGDDAQ